jgi:hypothetical protein
MRNQVGFRGDVGGGCKCCRDVTLFNTVPQPSMFDFQKAWWSRSMLPLLAALVLSVAQCEVLALKQTPHVAGNLCGEERAPTPLPHSQCTSCMHQQELQLLIIAGKARQRNEMFNDGKLCAGAL